MDFPTRTLDGPDPSNCHTPAPDIQAEWGVCGNVCQRRKDLLLVHVTQARGPTPRSLQRAENITGPNSHMPQSLEDYRVEKRQTT